MVKSHFATEAGVSPMAAPSKMSSWHCGGQKPVSAKWRRSSRVHESMDRRGLDVIMDLDRIGEAYLGDGPVLDGDAGAVEEGVGRHCLPHDAELQEPYLHLAFSLCSSSQLSPLPAFSL
jgi:hypothetical protein